MIESDTLFHSAAAILLGCVANFHPVLSRRFAGNGLILFVLGAMIPLLDFPWFFLISRDRIEFLAQTPIFMGLVSGMLLIVTVSLLTVFWDGLALARRIFFTLLAGFLTHQFLLFLTPAGIPLVSPFSDLRIGLPVFSEGHILLVILLGVLLALLESIPAWRMVVFRAGGVLVGLYLAAGVVQFGVVSLQAMSLAEKGESITVEPHSIVPARWMITVSDGFSYRVREHYIWYDAFLTGNELPRHNNETLMVKMLADPTVRYFYYRIFRHPVVKLESNGSLYTLVMQELSDQFPLVPGRTLYFEWDQDSKNRFYQIQRFD